MKTIRSFWGRVADSALGLADIYSKFFQDAQNYVFAFAQKAESFISTNRR